jgi:hypothetical protein
MPVYEQIGASPTVSSYFPASRGVIRHRWLGAVALMQTDWSFTKNNFLLSCKQESNWMHVAQHLPITEQSLTAGNLILPCKQDSNQ